MRNRIDLSGQRFGKLYALRDVGKDKNRSRMWYCLCSCGKSRVVNQSDLCHGKTNRCVACVELYAPAGRPSPKCCDNEERMYEGGCINCGREKGNTVKQKYGTTVGL